MRVILLMLVTSCLSCESKGNDAPLWVKPASITINCDEYHSVNTTLGVLNNNVWNKHAAQEDNWNQCLEKRTVNGGFQYGWSWSWPFGRNVIYAYPQIKIGSSPWAPEPKFDNAFPLKIADLKSLEILHEIEVITNGDHNIATTMWLVNEPYRGSTPKSSVIAVEVMIWTYATKGHFNPSGHRRGEITVDNTTWEVWYQKNWEDKSGVNGNKWVSVSFRAGTDSMKATIPALKLLNYAIQKRLISDDLYIADVELGNEVMSGSGITWTKKFSVLYETTLE